MYVMVEAIESANFNKIYTKGDGNDMKHAFENHMNQAHIVYLEQVWRG